MNFIDKEELLERLANRYGDLNDRCGCNVRTEDGFEWLSISNIAELIHDCGTYDGNESELEEKENQVEHLKKQIEELKAEYKKRLELLQTALLKATKTDGTIPGIRVSKADFVAMHSIAVRDMDGCEDNDIYGHDITVHWHGFYCNCGDGATPANYIIPGIEECNEEDPTEY